MKKVFILILIVILSLSVLAQQANVDKAYSWLLQKSISDVFQAAVSALAISRADLSALQPYLNYINSSKHPTQPCWPSTNCNVKDTSAVLLVESKLGLGSITTSESIVSWLVQKQSLAPLNGVWNLQIITPDSGQCSLKYQKQGEALSNEFRLEIDQGKISYGSCQNQYFFNLNTCLGTSILNKPSTLIEVSCLSLSNPSNAKISVVYTESGIIYLLDTPIPSRAQITINNGYFGNKLDTLYANWALKEANSNINSLIYLKKNQESKVVDRSLLYLITKNPVFLDSLLTLQGAFGEFQGQGESTSEFNNGLAGLALQESSQHATELELLKEWLGSRQKQDGSWSSDEKTTAIVLYGAFQGGNLLDTTQPPQPPPSGSTRQCGNRVLETGEQCDDGNTVPNDGCSPTCSIEQPQVTPNCTLLNPKWLSQNGAILSQARGFEAGRLEGDTVLLTIEGTQSCGTKQISFDIFEDEQGQDPLVRTLGPVQYNVQEGFIFVTWQPQWFDDNPLPNVEGDPEYYFIAKAQAISSTNSSLLQATKASFTQCSDGIDNDHNGLCDTPTGICINSSVTVGDPGCQSPNDLIENVKALACADGIDNDQDNLIDSIDPGCTSPFEVDNSEKDGDCTPSWVCDPWSICSIDNEQTRVCRDLNACGKECPKDNESCIVERTCPPGDTDGRIDLPGGGQDDSDKGDEDEGVPLNPCSVNNICEPEWGEDESNCPEDCKADTDATPPVTPGDFPPLPGDDESTPTDDDSEEKGSSNLLWVIVIILILILVGTYFFVFKKKPTKRENRPDFRLPENTTRRSIFSPYTEPKNQVTNIPKREKKSEIEEDLEKSLREAKRLLGR